MRGVDLCYTIMTEEWNFELGRLLYQSASRLEKKKGQIISERDFVIRDR